MPRFTVHGEVIRTIGNDLGIRVQNEGDLRAFWREHRIDTDLDWFGKGPPVVSIGRKEDIAKSKPGERASLTFVVQERAGGKWCIRQVIRHQRPDVERVDSLVGVHPCQPPTKSLRAN